MKFLIALCVLICQAHATTLPYGLDYKANANPAITAFKIFGERNSGTNFLEELVKANLLNNQKPLVLERNFGHKHYPCWYNQPQEFFHGPAKLYTLKGDNVLFLVIYRNPYDWLRSMRKKPFDANPNLRELPLSNFIRTVWSLNPENPIVKREEEKNPWVDRNPEDGSFFENLMQLRTAKIQTMQKIKDHAENVYYINYETLRDYPRQVLSEIATLFNLKQSKVYHPIIYQKGEKSLGIYKKKTYEQIDQKDLDFINEQLDWTVENSVNYTIVNNSSEIK